MRLIRDVDRGRKKMASSANPGRALGTNLSSISLLVLIVSSTLATAIGGSALGSKIHSDLNDKTNSISIGQQLISRTPRELLARTKRSFARSEEHKIANESQQAAQIIEFRISSDNQIPPANPNFEAAFQGECSRDPRRANLCDHICLDLYDGTFECACFYGFALAIDGYSCTRRPASDTPAIASSTRPSLLFEPNNKVAASETKTASQQDERTTAIDSPPYEVITQEEPEHTSRATMWPSRAGVVVASEPPESLLISNSSSSSSSSAQTRPAEQAGGLRHAIRKLASGPEETASQAQGQVVGGGAAGNRHHQSRSATGREHKNTPLGGGGGGGVGESKFRDDDDDAEPSDSKPARQAGESRDGGGGRRARASAAERARWKLPLHQRHDSKQFDGDASQRETQGQNDDDDDERQEVADANNEQRRSSAATVSNQPRKDELQENWISQAPTWTRVGRDEHEEESFEPRLASAGEDETPWRWEEAAVGSASKLAASLGRPELSDREQQAEDDERPRWPLDRSAGATNPNGAQDSPEGLEGDVKQAQEEESEIEKEEEEEREREHEALERDLGLLENLIGKTMVADYRRPHWPPPLPTKFDQPEAEIDEPDGGGDGQLANDQRRPLMISISQPERRRL